MLQHSKTLLYAFNFAAPVWGKSHIRCDGKTFGYIVYASYVDNTELN